MVSTIAPSSAASTASAGSGWRNQKKTGVQAAFSASCQPHRSNAGPACTRRQTRQAASPISTYSTVHTGPNTALGGVPGGCARDPYQPRSAETVSAPSEAPTSSPRPTKPTSARPGQAGGASCGPVPPPS